MKGLWLSGGACIALVSVILAWFAVPAMRTSAPQGVVRVAAESGTEVTGLPAPKPAPAMPSAAAMPSDPNDLYMRVRAETRDPAWATQAEAVLLENMQGVPKVGDGARLEAQCAATVCEVTGVAAPRESAEIVKQSMDALRRTVMGAALPAKGLAPVATQFGTAHSENEFTLYFRREDSR